MDAEIRKAPTFKGLLHFTGLPWIVKWGGVHNTVYPTAGNNILIRNAIFRLTPKATPALTCYRQFTSSSVTYAVSGVRV